ADVLALDWFRGADLELTQQGGSAVLRIPSMQQSYTLSGVPLASLKMSNFTFKDASAGAYLSGVLGSTAAPSPAPTPAPAPAPVPADGAATFVVSSDWGSGFNGDVTVRNTTAGAVTGWRATFDFDGEITSLWNGAVTSRAGATHVVTNASWNGGLGAGGAATFGFTATPGATGATLRNLRVTFVGATAPAPSPVPTPTP
ncbi:MAG TPA: hypothetical protein DC048_00445, partial [Planctomycetaceae bacterium]|nr:hypothetical protein [Planctomycetaceae bacterium]